MTLEPRRHQALNGSGEPAPGEGQAANGVAHSDNSGAAGDLPTLIEKIAAHIASSEDLVAQQVSPAQDIREGAALSPWDCQSADDLARVLGRLEETHEAPCAAPAPAGPEAVAPPSGVLTAPAIPGHDFDCFEHRLGVALHDVARRADVAGLRLVEAHVTEVLGELSAARRQLSRLDAIEEGVSRLARRASDARTSEPAGAAAISASDAATIAEAVADHLRHERSVLAGSIAGEVGALLQRQLSLQLPGERGEHGALDSMRRTIAGLTDRIDTFEQALVSRSNAAPAKEATAHEFSAASPPYQDWLPEWVAPSPSEATPETGAVAHRTFAPANSVLPGEAHPSSPDAAAAHPAAEARPPATAGAQEAVDDTAEQPPASLEDFVAAARRAAWQASNAPPEFQPARQRRPRPAGERGGPPETTSHAGLRLATMAVLLAVGVGLMTYTVLLGGPAGLARSERSSRPQETNAGRSGTGLVIFPTEDERVGAGFEVPSRERDGALSGEADPAPAAPPAAPSNIQRGPAPERGIDSSPPPGDVRPEDRAGGDFSGGADLIPVAASRFSAPDATADAGRLPPLSVGPPALRAAASAGDPSAEFEVGARLAGGSGTEPDYRQALVWYQRSAMRGFAPAQYRLGTLYERGLGVGADLARAKVWYQRAAEGGIVNAMHNLAVLAVGSDDRRGDYGTAAVWFRQAAERGLRDSQFNLAVLYENGLGLARDRRQAFKWFSIAAQAGDKEALRRRNEARLQLSPADLDAAEALARSWRGMPADPINDARAAGEVWKSRTASAG